MLLTNLVGRVQPLLPYKVTLAGGPNPLGLPYLRLAAVHGRSDDVVEEAPADTPVPELHRDPGHGTKVKLIRNAAAQARARPTRRSPG